MNNSNDILMSADDNFSKGMHKLFQKKKFMDIFNTPELKYEQSSEYFTSAGNLYKMIKQYEKAGKSFELAGDVDHFHLNNLFDAEKKYIDASNCFRQLNIYDKSIKLIEKALLLYKQSNNFLRAGKQYESIADIYENYLYDYKNAILCYENAVDCYDSDFIIGDKYKILEKIAILEMIHNANYEKSIEIFEEIASHTIKNESLKWKSTKNLFYACICYLCSDDPIGANIKLNEYIRMYYNFINSSECRFISNIIKTIENNDKHAFETVVLEYNDISAMNDLLVTLLLRIKKNLIKSNEIEL